MADFRADSRKNWGGNSTVEHINAGSLQRIADATEQMAKRHTELIRERDNYERMWRTAIDNIQTLDRRLAAAKGQITKLRNAAKKDTP